MTIESFETVLLTCIFIIPGFIIDGVVNSFSPPPKRGEAIHFLYYLLYSVLHCAVWSWLYIILWHIKEKHITWFLIVLCITAIVGSFLIGVIIGLFKSKEIIRRILRKMKCNISSSIPTAWDYFFSKQGSLFVIVTLNDDSKIYGLYGENSFTSSDTDERDVYIEKIYEIDENNIWNESEQNLGIYISKDQIKTIEFLQGEFEDGNKT